MPSASNINKRGQAVIIMTLLLYGCKRRICYHRHIKNVEQFFQCDPRRFPDIHWEEHLTGQVVHRTALSDNKALVM